MNVWYWVPSVLSESLEFGTEVLGSRTTERRVSYFDAVQNLSFEHIVSPGVAEEMGATYLADPNQTFLVPEWPTATIDRAIGFSASDTVIPVADDVVYAVGQKVIIGAGDSWEQGEVASLGGTSITLVSGIAASYAASSTQPVFVAPLIECICPNGVKYARTFPIRTVQVEFLSTAPIDIPENPYSLHDGLPYVDDGDALFDALTGSVGRASILVDSGFGSFEIVESEDYTRRSGTVSFSDNTYADRLARRRFFHFMRGRDGEMWTTSKQGEITLNSGFSSGALTIDVQPIAPASEMIGKTIRASEGDNSTIRLVTDATDNSATSQTLTVAAMGFVGTSSAKVELATKCRFDADAFNISYQFAAADLLARCTMPTIEVV